MENTDQRRHVTSAGHRGSSQYAFSVSARRVRKRFVCFLLMFWFICLFIFVIVDFKWYLLQYNAIQFDRGQYNEIQCHTNAKQCNYSEIFFGRKHNFIVEEFYCTMQCNTMQCKAIEVSIMHYKEILQ